MQCIKCLRDFSSQNVLISTLRENWPFRIVLLDKSDVTIMDKNETAKFVGKSPVIKIWAKENCHPSFKTSKISKLRID